MMLAAAMALLLQPQEETLNLRQITIQIPPGLTKAQEAMQRDAFAAATRAIVSCDRIDATVRQWQAEFVAVDDAPLSILPSPLREQLAGTPAGTATQVFGESPTYRVLIRC